MSKKANPAVIGGFVVGALVLVLAAVVIFGSGILVEKTYWVMYFDGSIKGLNVGAPVDFRGVRVGTVSDVKVVIDPVELTVRTPVYVEVERDRLTILEPTEENFVHRIMSKVRWLFSDALARKYHARGEALIDRGLRAQLALQSLVTGQLFVQLDFHPDEPVRLLGLDDKVQEFPTIPSRMERLAQKFEEMPIEDLVNAALRAVDGIGRLVTAPEMMDSMRSLKAAMHNVEVLTRDVNARFPALDHEIVKTLEATQSTMQQAETTLKMEEGVPGKLAGSFQATLNQAERTLKFEEGAPGRLVASLRKTSDAAGVTLEKSQVTLATIQGAIGEQSPLRYELSRGLQELAAAARAIRALADYLERHPEALLVGKGQSGSRG